MSAVQTTISTCIQQRGQSALEFLIVLPVLVFLVFGVLQWALIYQARSTLNHAAFLAARAGALNNGSPSSMESGLAAGLTPLFAASASPTGYLAARVKAEADIKLGSALTGTTKLQILNPTKAAIKDFGRDRLDKKSGKEIPNDTLMYRNTSAGKNSKISVQDANILHLRVTYCYRLIVPVVNRMIHAAANAGLFSKVLDATGMDQPFGDIHDSDILSSCPSINGPRIPLRSEAIFRMQSPFHEAYLK